MESARKQEIIAEAAQLFATRGYHATSMRDLAKALALQGGSLYSHIDSKEELLWLIVDEAASQFLAMLHAVTASDTPPEATLRDAVRGHVGVIANDLAAATVYFHEWRFLTEPRRSAFLARRRDYEARFRQIVAAAVVDSPAVDPKWATTLILSATNWLYQWYDPAGPLPPDELADRYITMLFHGILMPQPVP
ncbi:MAG: TetR family transcriptional regulator [Anaerolineales bacterium]|nr:TetR family transcriptional regulator [Anaerolineales bacterium]MCB9126698.1 TetR/AcrR family transcriptional regulator [Ardenticatenales bacterium]MCB9171760.1 TetR/AcrR family transcriptional regulator [Ardenticatenales bacterium]